MIVTIELACDLRQIRYHRGDFTQVDTVAREGEVLQHRRVLILGIEFQTGLVVGDEVNLCLYLLVAA